MPNLETALVRQAVDASSSMAFMPQPCCKARMAVKDIMLAVVSQKVQNAAKSIVFVGLLPCIIQALYSSAKRPM